MADAVTVSLDIAQDKAAAKYSLQPPEPEMNGHGPTADNLLKITPDAGPVTAPSSDLDAPVVDYRKTLPDNSLTPDAALETATHNDRDAPVD